jgi:hypothetical protein
MFPLPINIYFEIAAFIASVIFWKQIKTTRLRWLMPFLFFILCIELTGRYLTKELTFKNNGWLYNISIPIEYIFYAYTFYLYFSIKKYKTIARVFLFGFPFFVLFNMIFIQGFLVFNNNILKIGSVCMIMFCCLYFFNLLKMEKIVNPISLPFFWITSGLFIFNLGEFVYIALSTILFSDWVTFRSLVKMINNNLIYVLYGSIIIGLILAKWDQEEKI